MCDPVTLTVLAVAGATAGVISKNEMNDATLDAMREQASAVEEEMSAQQDQAVGERVKQGRAERARMRVAAGEAGLQVDLGSTGIAELDSFMQQSQDNAAIAKQAGFNARAANANFRTNSVGLGRVDPITAGLQIASAGVGGYNQGLQIQAAKKAGEDG